MIPKAALKAFRSAVQKGAYIDMRLAERICLESEKLKGQDKIALLILLSLATQSPRLIEEIVQAAAE